MELLKSIRFALTWGDCGENHVGNQKIGILQKSGTGITLNDLMNIKQIYEENGGITDLKVFNVPDDCPHKNNVGVLVLRNFLTENEQILLHNELNLKTWDSKFLNTRTNKVLNKHARHNLMFQHGVSQEANYEKGQGTIKDIDEMPILFRVDKKVKNIAGEKDDCELICEGNKYRTEAKRKCDQQGIGYHGDSERTRVFAISVGGYDYPIQWVLFKNNKPQMSPEKVLLNSGDMYIMSEKAIGQDWKKSSMWTWRHAAGHEKYISMDKWEKK